MAKKLVQAIIDIEFPDDLVNDGEPGDENTPNLAGFNDELDKIIQAGCAENGFDYERIETTTRIMNTSELIYDLEEQ